MAATNPKYFEQNCNTTQGSNFLREAQNPYKSARTNGCKSSEPQKADF
jgi:hypothetical protein